MVGADGQLPLPWLAEPLRHALKTQHAHALLVYGASGVGQFELSMTLAQAWLCESKDDTPKPCGKCASCRLVQAHSHPDLMVLLPEALQESLGWGPGEGAEAKASKAKPS
ncbi:MAG: polymerase subunit delta, partial [Rhizobacter sp.]|nr:polymerase subunit delta [Rhizobacter sp.]